VSVCLCVVCVLRVACCVFCFVCVVCVVCVLRLECFCVVSVLGVCAVCVVLCVLYCVCCVCCMCCVLRVWFVPILLSCDATAGPVRIAVGYREVQIPTPDLVKARCLLVRRLQKNESGGSSRDFHHLVSITAEGFMVERTDGVVSFSGQSFPRKFRTKVITQQIRHYDVRITKS